jgi:hypothetical protein
VRFGKFGSTKVSFNTPLGGIMKQVVASLLFVLVGSSALAAEISWNAPYAEPCQSSPDVPVPANGVCPEGAVCPVGYEPMQKTCWNGGHFENCGLTCKESTLYKHH